MASITMKNLTKIYEEREVGFFKKKKEEKIIEIDGFLINVVPLKKFLLN